MNSAFLFISGLLVVMPSYLSVGQKVISPEVDPLNSRFDNFQIRDGVASPTTLCLMQDSKGFIWSGNEKGLYRFDGISHYRYAFGNSDTTLQGYAVISLCEDSRGDIWAGTYGALNRVNLQSGSVSHFIPDTINHDNPDNIIHLVREDTRGNIWIITGGDVFMLDRGNDILNRLPVDSLAWKTSPVEIVNEKGRFTEDGSGNILIATDNGLYLHDNNNARWSRVYPSQTTGQDSLRHVVSSVIKDYKDQVWFGTNNEGLFKAVTSGRMVFEKVELAHGGEMPEPKTISALYADSLSVWAFGEGNLFRIDPESGESISYRISDDAHGLRHWKEKSGIDMIFSGPDNTLFLINLNNGLAFNFNPVTEKLFLYVSPVYIALDAIIDYTGCLWFATVNNNIFRLTTHSYPVMSKRVNTNSFAEITRKTILLADADGSLRLRLNDGFYTTGKIDPDGSVTLKKMAVKGGDNNPGSESCLFRDSRNNIWYGYAGGIAVRYNPLLNEYKRFPLPVDPGLDSYGNIRIISEDSSGNIWFATLLEGIFILPKGENKADLYCSYSELSGSGSISYLYDFRIGHNDELWIANSHGLYRLNGQGNGQKIITVFDITGQALGNIYVRIAMDSQGRVWVLNEPKGLFIHNVESDTFIRPQLPPLSEGGFYADLLFDNSDRIWLARYDRITVIDKKAGTSTDFLTPVKGFDAQSILHPSGLVVYMIADRLLVIPEDLPRNQFIPPVYITGILINGKEYNKIFPDNEYVTVLKSIVLNSNQNHLKIEFAVLNYLSPELNRYRYYMAGIDKDTVEVGPGTAAEYRKMSPGRYRFWVTGSNNDSVWNKEGKSIDIRILPPWYRSTIALISYSALFMLLISYYVRYRTTHLENEKLRLEAEISKHTAALEQKNRQLAETDLIKTRFFTDISHEIRTPLSLIMGPINSLSKESDLTEKQYAMVEMMKRNSDRLMSMVNQMLDISRLDAGKLKITMIFTDVIRCLRILIYEFLSLAETKDIHYIAELPGNEHKTWFDRDKTEKIISNLLSNAFRFTPRGGKVYCTVTLESGNNQPEHDILQIRVTDSGPGIRKEDQAHIFDRFYTTEAGTEAESHGTGIGLALVKEFTDLLHGTVSLTSEPGVGSEFIVRLPLGKEHLSADEYVIVSQSDDPSDHSGTAPVYPTSLTRSNGKTKQEQTKILVIEDNYDLRYYICQNLSDDYQVLEADNGGTGLNIAITMMPDLIITDILMPGIDGLTLCSKIKNDDHTSHIPVIILTAKASSNEKMQGLQSGADDYLIKPFDIVELKIRISNLLRTRETLKLKYSRPYLYGTDNAKIESADDRFIARVVKIISDNLMNFDFDTGSLQEAIGMSRMHLNRKLKILTGLSPAALIRSIRLERAAELLNRRTGNITEIANSVGISNPAGFTRSFRKYFGVSPRNYHRQ